MSFYNVISENIMLPLNDKVFNRKVSEFLNFLNKSQWWSSEEIEDYQNEKLRELITHAYKYVPYYSNLFKDNKLTPGDIKTKKDLIKIPLLTKEIIRENFPKRIVSSNIKRSDVVLSGSSGSTGQPLQYYREKSSLDFSRACNLRAWQWMGFRLGDKYLKLSTMPRNTLNKKIQDYLNQCIFINSRSITDKDIIEILELITKKKIKYMRGYPASLYIIARYCKKHQINNIKLKAINTTSEPLYDNMRKEIEECFHCIIYDSYGAEGAPVISQCDTHQNYHIAEEKAIVEFIRNGENVDSGKVKLVFTDLTNFATPFIRYDIQDFATIDSKLCGCGRGLRTLSKIEGRDTDILITPSGRFITFYFFAGYFEHQNYIDMFQLVQENLDKFILKIQTNHNYHSNLKKMLHNDIIKVLGNDVNLIIEEVKNIPLTSSGKRRFFIRNKDIPLIY